MNNKTKQLFTTFGTYGLFLFLSVFSIYWVWLKGPTYFNGDDLAFHLARIEGLSQSISSGEFLPRINYFLAEGMGYPTGIFYPELFLYPAAILRYFGFSVVTSYQLYLILLNFITFVIAYNCFYSVNKSKWGALLFSVIYGLSSYRMSDVLYRAAIGESLAFLFFPLVYVGIYQIIYGDKKKWWILAIGMTGLVYSHPLSALLSCIFLLVYCLISIRPLFKDRSRLLRLVLATGAAALLSVDVYLPMLEQVLFQRLRMQDVSMFYLAKEAQSIGEYLSIAYNNIGYNNIGILIPIGLLIGLIYLKKESKENQRLLFIAILFFFLATSYFPHALFHGTFFNAIQFPWRYFLIVTFLVCWFVADSLVKVNKLTFKTRTTLVGLLLLLTIGLNLQNQLQLNKFRPTTAKQFEQLDGNSLGYGKEFLPSGMEAWATPTSLLSEPQAHVEITNMSRNSNAFFLHYNVSSSTRLIYPILYYKGYVAEVNGTEKAVEDAESYKGTNMHGLVQVTVKGKGTVLVWYKGTIIQKVSRWISLVSLMLFFFYIVILPKVTNHKDNNQRT